MCYCDSSRQLAAYPTQDNLGRKLEYIQGDLQLIAKEVAQDAEKRLSESVAAAIAATQGIRKYRNCPAGSNSPCEVLCSAEVLKFAASVAVLLDFLWVRDRDCRPLAASLKAAQQRLKKKRKQAVFTEQDGVFYASLVLLILDMCEEVAAWRGDK